MARSVREVMTPGVRTVSPAQSLAEAAEAMKVEHVGSLPVVEEGRLMGIVTDRDMVGETVEAISEPTSTERGQRLWPAARFAAPSTTRHSRFVGARRSMSLTASSVLTMLSHRSVSTAAAA